MTHHYFVFQDGGESDGEIWLKGGFDTSITPAGSARDAVLSELQYLIGDDGDPACHVSKDYAVVRVDSADVKFDDLFVEDETGYVELRDDVDIEYEVSTGISVAEDDWCEYIRREREESVV